MCALFYDLPQGTMFTERRPNSQFGQFSCTQGREVVFDTMISKSLIQVIWVVASLAVVIASLSTIFVVGGGGGFFLGMVYLILGLAWVRVICEGMIILFVMNENLQRSTRSLERLVQSQDTLISRLTSLSGNTAVRTVPAQVTAAHRPAEQHPVRSQAATAPPASRPQQNPDDKTGPVRESKSKLGDWPSQ